MVGVPRIEIVMSGMVYYCYNNMTSSTADSNIQSTDCLKVFARALTPWIAGTKAVPHPRSPIVCVKR